MKNFLKLCIAYGALCVAVLPALAQQAGKTYTISSQANANLSLFVSNSSLAEKASVVSWTETNVPSQQWTLESSDDGGFLIRNVHSGLYLSRASASLAASGMQQCTTAVGDRARWNIKPIEGKNGLFAILPATSEGHALSAAATADGTAVTTTRINTDDERQQFILTEVEPKAVITSAMKAEMMNDFVTKFLRKRSSTTATFGSGGGWGDAEMLETVLDALETTGDKTYADLFTKVYAYIHQSIGTNYCQLRYDNVYHWFGHEFNDDVMWLVIAAARASFLTGEGRYLSYARSNFNKVYQRGLLSTGMIRWKEGNGDGTNSCINFPTVVAGCYLGKGFNNEDFYRKALNIYKVARGHLFNPADGHVYDSTSINGDTNMYGWNSWASTYNQGTFIGAALMLYEHYGDESFANDARMAFDYTKKHLCNSDGIIHVCQVVDGDLCGFKGILMRYVRRLAVDLDDADAMEWLQKNAMYAYCNRNSSGVTSSCWLTKSGEDWKVNGEADYSNEPFGCSTAVSAIFNAPLARTDFHHDAYAGFGAEKFNYMKALLVADSEGMLLQGGRPGSYAIYNNVDFGKQAADKLTLRISPVNLGGQEMQVYADSLQGTLLGTLSFQNSGTWQSYDVDILPIDGIHNICLCFDNNAGVTEYTYGIDNLRFSSSLPVLNGSLMSALGTITTDADIDNVADLIDTRLSTAVTVPSGTSFTYRCQEVLRANPYKLTFDRPENAPVAWTLEGSNNNRDWKLLDTRNLQSFTQQADGYVNDLSSYRYYRLTVQGAADEVVLREWQLFGRCLSSNCITTDGGSFTTDTKQQKVYASKGNYGPEAYSITIPATTDHLTCWTLEGSADNKTWAVLDRKEAEDFWVGNGTQFYDIDADGTYTYFRLTVGDSNTDDFQLQLFGNVRPAGALCHDVLASGGELLSSDGQGNETLMAAVDSNVDSYVAIPWSSERCFIQYEAPMEVRPMSMTLAAGPVLSSNPRTVQLDGSNDGQAWTKLASGTVALTAAGAVKDMKVNSTKSYRFFRLSFTRLASDDAATANLSEWKLYGTALSSESLANSTGTCSVDGPEKQASESAPMLVDGSKDTKVLYQCFVPSNVMYKAASAQKVNLYSITAANDAEGRDPQDWTFEASNDGRKWTVLDRQKDEQFKARFSTQFYPFYNEDTYKYYRLNITRVRGNDDFLCQMAELQMFYSDAVAAEVEQLMKDEYGPSDGKGRIYDIAGRLVRTFTPAERLNIETTLPRGLYIIKVGTQTKKVNVK